MWRPKIWGWRGGDVVMHRLWVSSQTKTWQVMLGSEPVCPAKSKNYQINYYIRTMIPSLSQFLISQKLMCCTQKQIHLLIRTDIISGRIISMHKPEVYVSSRSSIFAPESSRAFSLWGWFKNSGGFRRATGLTLRLLYYPSGMSLSGMQNLDMLDNSKKASSQEKVYFLRWAISYRILGSLRHSKPAQE